MSRFYSQNGEDFVLNELFKDQEAGFFIEIGCIDGQRFSNTLVFEEKGWHGLCVEAHVDYIELLKKNRPNSIVCHCAVGECNEDNVEFFANSRGALSTLDKTKEKEFKQRFPQYFSGFETQTVNKRRLDSLLEEFNINHVDILSIDVEGYEVNVLKGIAFDVYKPRVIVVESDDQQHEKQLDHLLLKNGYYKSIRVVNNIFYLLEKEMEKAIKNKTISGMVTYTEHPLDDGGDIVKPFTIQL